MKTSYYRIVSLTAFGAALGMTACASGPQKVNFPSDTSPQAKMTELKDRLKSDQAKQYDVMSPSNFQGAAQSLATAQDELNNSKPATRVLEDEGQAAAYLQIVEENGTKNATQLQSVLTARQFAIDARAPSLQPNELADADKDFRSFGSDIESKSFNPSVKDLSSLEAKYSKVEIDSVKLDKLANSKKQIDQAQDRGAKSKAPKTYAEAQLKYDTALRSIEANRRTPSGYQASVDDSNKTSDKLSQVMNTIGSSETSEMAAVKIYDQQQQLAQSHAQTADAQQQADAARMQATQEAQKVSTLQDQNSQYADKEANNAKIAKVKEEFAPEEAEVLRDGNKIILRLKDMKFSTARSELTQSSIETLQKVKDMIAAVEVSKVVVEGHTDNVGGEKKNMTLSQSRADTVKKYLVAEKSVPDTEVEAKGYGYEHPLTSNKTAQGRSVNRRVDVIIETNESL